MTIPHTTVFWKLPLIWERGIKVHAKMYGDFSGALPSYRATVLILCMVWDLTWP